MDEGKLFSLEPSPNIIFSLVYTADPKGESLHFCYKTDNIDLSFYHCPQAGVWDRVRR